MKMIAVASHVQVGLPLRAWRVLNQWRIVTPIRKTSEAMIQLYFVANASGSWFDSIRKMTGSVR